MSDYLTSCEESARAGGQVLLDWAGRFSVREKGVADLVTEADLASQDVIRERLLGEFPEHGFLAEEQNLSVPSRKDGLRWIVDPLDGTTNYVHGMPNYSVSVALEQKGELLAGAVYDPVADEMYSAAAGKGARLNGRPLSVSNVDDLSRALVAVSFPAGIQRDDPQIAAFVELLVASQAIRRLGSAALNLCYLAAGRLDAYWAANVQAWDIAAGWLIVNEAQGAIVGLNGATPDVMRPRFVAASTDRLARQVLEHVDSPAPPGHGPAI